MLLNRRHRHFNPASAGAVVALDARFLTGLADGDSVTSWTRTGSATGTSAVPPKFKIGIMNGSNAVRFALIDRIDIGVVFSSGGATAIVVTTMASGSGAFARLASLWGTSGGRDFDSTPNVALLLRDNGSAAIGAYYNSSPHNSRAVTYDVPFVGTGLFGGNTIKTGVNGTFSTATPTTSTLSVSYVTIGVSDTVGLADYLVGDFAAIVVVPSAISDAIRRRIEQSLAFSFRIACA
jgi:hypothetical protein